MDRNEKLYLTKIGKLDYFNNAIKNLTIGYELDEKQKSYLLSCALTFFKYYQADNRKTSFEEFAYYIILKYSVSYNDYKPLYDFSINFGFYPTAKFILDKNLIESTSINDCLISIELEKFEYSGYIETLEQKIKRQNVLESDEDEICYIAPTSFGKSSLIIDLLRNENGSKKVAIIVPTKSLLMQTYRLVRSLIGERKIIIHDDMYSDEESFIGVLTQERAFRLIKKHRVVFDKLYIDEAHNLFNRDSRNILLSRLIKTSKSKNHELKIVYLSPLINDAYNLSTHKGQKIIEQKVDFNIKEPQLFEFKNEKEVYQYNRFTNQFYLLEYNIIYKNYLDFIFAKSFKKNLIYIRSPRGIEQFSKYFYEDLEEIETKQIYETSEMLKKYVHERFYAVDLLKKGVIYLHGKIPDIIKEYLEEKFSVIREIKYLVANTVILEGMNLPIDNLFILNTYSLNEKELKNLIGRVNRLNLVFNNKDNSLDKLLPHVYFVNNKEYSNGKMRNKIIKLRSNVFKDDIENPTLLNFDISKIKDKAKLQRIKKIISNEQFLYETPINESELLKKYLIQENISEFYSDIDKVSEILIKRINFIKKNYFKWSEFKMLDKINLLFIKNIDFMKDFELLRLKEKPARNFYEAHIKRNHTNTLKANINEMFQYLRIRSLKSDDCIFYVGDTYGEITRVSSVYSGDYNRPVYVDLSEKSDDELINLSIIKLKLENDFVSYKINKFIIMLYDYDLISEDEFNTYIYGTIDKKKIELYKIGLSGNLINKLETDNQLKNISFDKYGNIITNEEFEEFKKSADDFYKFEIDRLL